MKIFRKNADYAVRTLVFLATQGGSQEHPGYISTTTLAKELGLPLNYLRRICSKLIKAGILDTREGAGGGIRLLKNAADITILELMELLDGPPEISDCTFQKKVCANRKSCVLRRRILEIEKKVILEFGTITIQSLIDDLSA